MSNKAIEVILSRQLADCLNIPCFLVDTKGDLIFYNVPAEKILGRRFEDTGPMAVEEWSTVFNPEDDDGLPIAPEKLPLVQTLNLKIPAQGSFWIKNLSGGRYRLSVTSIPIIGQADRFQGALAIFWENQSK